MPGGDDLYDLVLPRDGTRPEDSARAIVDLVDRGHDMARLVLLHAFELRRCIHGMAQSVHNARYHYPLETVILCAADPVRRRA